MTRRGGSALAVLALLAAATGCGGSLNGTRSLNSSEFAFLAGGGVIPQDQQYLFSATQQLIHQCMTARGFRYIPAHLATASPLAAANNELTTDGQAPSESVQLLQRERVGYGIYETFLPKTSSSEESTTPPNDLYVRALTPATQERYMQALEGSPSQRAQASPPGGPAYTYVTGGCIGRVDSELYGSPAVANSIVATPQSIRLQVISETQSNPTVVGEKLAWSKCMAAITGRDFADPPAVESWLDSQYSHAGPATALRHLEIALATADTRCAYKTGLAQGYAFTFRRLANHLSPSLQGTLLSLLEQDRSATRRAQSILGSSQ